ncbi:uncharacterized protein TRIADDRAFT_61808 [Trichoplax adhaerens]|uniref:Toll-interacting protein n=1 Tax=Trichoplax adhaerens TaxID=10228 RepID=B3SC10_TRIAD|nr:hypothetical protein TRIADDRAFT_61808 [Trichoplax adhaerens]EDV19768.1 hypothetical protein TRIADDRAFT_61808 [Trichoplax adhaerens]|eukprot:XP_002117792.1 hypothetical protein TRIADDRAFT_61808 [Trichoplax adhaerens]
MEVTQTNSNHNNQLQKWRNKVVTGNLSDDFLRISSSRPVVPFQQTGFQSQVHFSPINYYPIVQTQGTLKITVAQAKLVKNYGYTRMDPYCKIRVGHNVMETPTDGNGSKTPRWNKTFTFPLPSGVDSIYLEIYSERSIVSDDRIAWMHINIPEAVMNHETVEDWYSLTGKQGENKEGMIKLILSYYPPSGSPVQQHAVPNPTQTSNRQGYDMNAQISQMTSSYESTASVESIKGMFPTIDEEVIRSVLASNGWNVNAAINDLLSMNS